MLRYMVRVVNPDTGVREYEHQHSQRSVAILDAQNRGGFVLDLLEIVGTGMSHQIIYSSH